VARAPGYRELIERLAAMVLLQLIAGLRTWSLTYFAARARDPVPMKPKAGLRVAVLTTIVPGKEPLELVMTTLRAMKRIRHEGRLDVWLLDEGNDPEVRRRCKELDVRHFSRKDQPQWNQSSGEFKTKTKHGNHNAWRSVHELDYDVVAQMDPDHVPYPNFLERTSGYFADPDTAFVVAPQVYGNLTESFVARGAAELAYIFHGIIQRGGNGHGAPLLIGTNHLYRPATFRQIGGYQDCIIEDHLTSMVVYGSVNPVTGNNWRGVYTLTCSRSARDPRRTLISSASRSAGRTESGRSSASTRPGCFQGWPRVASDCRSSRFRLTTRRLPSRGWPESL
jgi:cellulose synthase/poly-beta-1,6-N-acetylglucosamine synthase-like glycosyltransferase